MNRTLDAIRVLVLVGLPTVTACMDRDLAGMDPVVQAVAAYEVVQPPSGKGGLGVVVDNSGSMNEEQLALANNLPTLVQELMSPSDPGHVPVTDLNVAIVSTDMGSGGFELNTCQWGAWGYAAGDDGCFRNSPSGTLPGCVATYPRHLHRGPDNDDSYPLDRMGADFACMATLGTGGCGFEQQLEAARKGLVEQTAPDGCNAGFLRDDSILAVVVVSDEEDCSVEDTRILNPDADEFGPLNVRCYLHGEMLKNVGTMVSELRSMRANPRDFVMAMIVGVPMSPACEAFGNDIEGCLALPEMQYGVDGTGTNFLPVCRHPLGWGTAVPGRRFIEAAQQIGENALVRSICNENWRPAMAGILGLIHNVLDDVCFAHELSLDTETCSSECNIIETLSDNRLCPAGRVEADPPTETDEDGVVHRRCVILQAQRTPDADGTCPNSAGSGWYYVPRAQSGDADCDQVRFAADAVPEPLSSTQVECLSYVCPAERRCGGSSNPGGRCCGVDEVCLDLDPVSGGRCASP